MNFRSDSSSDCFVTVIALADIKMHAMLGQVELSSKKIFMAKLIIIIIEWDIKIPRKYPERITRLFLCRKINSLLLIMVGGARC